MHVKELHSPTRVFQTTRQEEWTEPQLPVLRGLTGCATVCTDGVAPCGSDGLQTCVVHVALLLQHHASTPTFNPHWQLIIIIIIHTFSMVLFPAERAQRACSHTCS